MGTREAQVAGTRPSSSSKAQLSLACLWRVSFYYLHSRELWKHHLAVVGSLLSLLVGINPERGLGFQAAFPRVESNPGSPARTRPGSCAGVRRPLGGPAALCSPTSQGTGLDCGLQFTQMYLTCLQPCHKSLTQAFGALLSGPSPHQLYTKLAPFFPDGPSPTGIACWNSTAPWSSSCTDCTSSASWQEAPRSSWRPSAMLGTSSPLPSCTSGVSAQGAGVVLPGLTRLDMVGYIRLQSLRPCRCLSPTRNFSDPSLCPDEL